MKKILLLAIIGIVTFINNGVYAQDPPDAGDNDTTCIGGGIPPYVLSATSGTGTGFWTGPPGTYFSDETSPETEVSPPNFSEPYASYWFTWCDTAGAYISCDSVQITFARVPNAVAGDNQYSCGDTLYLEADTTGSGWAESTWTSIPGIEFSDLHDPNSAAIIVNNGVYNDLSIAVVPIVWIMDNLGCIALDTVYHTFYEQPVANAYSFPEEDVWVCGLEFDMLAAYSIDSSNGEWAALDAVGVVFYDMYDPETQVTVPDSGYYTFTWHEENAYNPLCTSTDTVVIHFIAIPDIFAGFDTAVCSDSFDLECVSDMGTGAWSNNTAVWIIDQSDPHSNTGPYGGAQDEANSYIWTEWNGPNGECISQDTVEIYFAKMPEPIHFMGEDTIYNCGLITSDYNDLDAPLNIQYPGFWTAPYTSGETYDPDSSFHTAVEVTVPEHGVHYFFWVLENVIDEMHSCFGWSDSVIINFIEMPVADAGGGDDNADTACGTEFILHPIQSVGSAVGSWYTECQAFFLYDSTELSYEPNDTIISEIENYICKLVWTEDNGYGCSDKDTLNLTFALIPDTYINWDMPLCVGYESFVWAMDDTLVNYTWNFGTGQVDSFEVNSENGMWAFYVHWEDGEPEHIVTLVATNSYGCSSEVIIDTVREPDPLGIIFDIMNDTCGYGNGSIEVEAFGGTAPGGSYAFTWLPDTNFVDPHDTIQTGLSHDTYYTVQVMDENYCILIDSALVEGTGIVNAWFDYSVSQEAPPVDVVFTNLTVNGDIYEWDFGDGETSTETNPVHTYNIPVDSILVRLIAWSPEECVDTLWRYVDYDPQSINDPEENNFRIYPNPFTSSTELIFELQQPSYLEIDIYDIIGNKVMEVVRGKYPAGRNTLSVNTDSLKKGLYILHIQSENFIINSKIMKM